MHKTNHHQIPTFFKGIPSFSGSIPWIAIKTSAGVSTGPDCDDPCKRTLQLIQLQKCTQQFRTNYLLKYGGEYIPQTLLIMEVKTSVQVLNFKSVGPILTNEVLFIGFLW